jgi:hypothetical protein
MLARLTFIYLKQTIGTISKKVFQDKRMENSIIILLKLSKYLR